MRRIVVLLFGAALLLAAVPAVSAGTPSGGSGGQAVPTPAGPPIAGATDPIGMTTVIVTMRDQVDLRGIPGANQAARQAGIIRALQAQAAASQLPLVAYLDRKAAVGRVARHVSFWVFNGLSVTATPDVILEVANRPDVAGISPDRIDVRPAGGATVAGASSAPAEPSLGVVNAPALWSLGYTGQGVVVANLDSGVDASHPDLSGRWRGGTNSWFDAYGQHPTNPIDLTGHGTATMGIMVGGDAGGTSIGMAPGSTWIAARIFNDSGTATATAIHSAFQWTLDPDGNPATPDAPQVVNNSWAFGSPGCNLEFQLDLQALRAVDIVPVFAAGNFGPGGSTSVSPANYPEALAVGATDNSDVLYASSSRGPSACGEAVTTYPEVVAPGVNVRTADRFGFYQVATGTSISAPHVAGALALLLSAHPGLGAAYQVSAISASARDLGAAGPDNGFGYGRLDVLAAHQWIDANPPTPPTPPPAVTAISPTSGPTAGGTAVAITGSGFGTAPGATTVAFGTSAATGVSCASSTSCTATSPAGALGTVDVRVTVAGQTSAAVTADRFTYAAAMTTVPVSVPALGSGYGYWYTFTSQVAGTVSATWKTPKTIQGTLAIYAGNPFAGKPDPVKLGPPAGALATAKGKKNSFSVTTTAQPAGVYTVYFHAAGTVANSNGTVTFMK